LWVSMLFICYMRTYVYRVEIWLLVYRISAWTAWRKLRVQI